MSELFHWMTIHWLSLMLIIGVTAAITFVSLKRKSLFYKE